jgi:hypothetical protein
VATSWSLSWVSGSCSLHATRRRSRPTRG